MTMTVYIAAFIAIMGVLVFLVLRTPAGMEGERFVRQGRIFTRTRVATPAGCDEVLRLLQEDWIWWKNGRAEKMRDLGNGQKGFLLHPLRFFGFLEFPTTVLVKFERVEELPGGGKRIYATLTGDFDGPAEYAVWPSGGGSMAELAWCGVEVKGIFRFNPVFVVAAVHHWREKLGAEGLRDRLASRRTESSSQTMSRS